MDRFRAQVIEINDWLVKCNKEIESLPSNIEWDKPLSELEELVDRLSRDLEDKQEAAKFWKLCSRFKISSSKRLVKLYILVSVTMTRLFDSDLSKGKRGRDKLV